MVCFDSHCPYNVPTALAAAKKQNSIISPPSHYHCAQNNGRCHFVAKESNAMDKHMLDAHTNGKTSNTYLRNKFECFYNLMDCQITGCSSNQRTSHHWHCQSCQRELTEPGDMDIHVCHASVDSINNNKQLKLSDRNISRNSLSPQKLVIDEDHNGDASIDESDRNISKTPNYRDSFASSFISDTDNSLLSINRKRAAIATSSPLISADDEKVSGN